MFRRRTALIRVARAGLEPAPPEDITGELPILHRAILLLRAPCGFTVVLPLHCAFRLPRGADAAGFAAVFGCRGYGMRRIKAHFNLISQAYFNLWHNKNRRDVRRLNFEVM